MSDDEVEHEDEEMDDKKEDIKSERSPALSSSGLFRYKGSFALRTFAADESSLTEAGMAMLVIYFVETSYMHEEEDAARLEQYQHQRRNEREREEEELRVLKEKQEQRRLQREEEEREQVERQKLEEDRRRQEEETRKARIEEERIKKAEAIYKRQKLIGAGFASIPNGTSGRNFILPEKKEKGGDKFGNIVQAKQEMGMTYEQQENAKRSFLDTLIKTYDINGLSGLNLKAKIKEMHQKICKLETQKYDLEKRHERQEYDLKELNERQRQLARNRALKKGLDPSDVGNSRYPAKISTFSKYDRQTDRRNFEERRRVFDKKNAIPCFPNVPPPPTVLVFKLDASKDDENKV
uniref:Troponin T n=1 Tax=Ditylenchus dipsaci TaxID=166011 RepID=A0A915EEV1_9BILA